METTLQNGDRLLVWKVGKSWKKLVGDEYIPKRWDIVVFDKPESNTPHSSSVDHLIKRVIALPGERVTVIDGSVSVYNDENPDGFNPDKDQEYSDSFDYTSGNVDTIVGENEVFVLGDNRGKSLDSRVFGPINADLLTGTAEIRIAPVSNFEKF